MILACPFCGTELSEALADGLASCLHCNRAFDSSTSNKLLSAFWLLLNNDSYHGIDELISDTRLADHEAVLVYAFFDEGYSYEEFFKALKKLTIIE